MCRWIEEIAIAVVSLDAGWPIVDNDVQGIAEKDRQATGPCSVVRCAETVPTSLTNQVTVRPHLT